MGRVLFSFLILIFCGACTGRSPVDKALEVSGENREELEAVIRHFSEVAEDSMKLQAAIFLIRNMPAHFHTTYNRELYLRMDSLNRSDVNLNELYLKCDTLKKRYPQLATARLDITSLKSGFLIRHIDRAVDIWRNSPWYDPSAFGNFCEYVLPYAAANEAREFWLDHYHEKYRHYLAGYRQTTGKDSFSLAGFCDFLNDTLIKSGKMVLNSRLLNQYPPLMLDNIRSGVCDDYGARTIFIMRSLGMPVGFDFSPQWTGYVTSHSWNVLIDNDNNVYPFMGFDENIAQWKMLPTFHCSKVFRKMYSIQPESLAARHPTEELPDFLSMPDIEDVTDQYIPVHTVEVELPGNKDARVAYLCVFKNEWSVAHWGEVKNGKAVFEKMGGQVMYLPACYRRRRLVQAGHPFYIDSLGNKKEIVPDPVKKQRMRVERKYPYSVKTDMFLKRMLKGRFQGSDSPDFKQADDLYTINELPKITPNTVGTGISKKYRYVRYIGGPGSFANIAEVEFYASPEDMENGRKLQGRIIGTDNDPKIDNRGYNKENVFDGDPLTFFNSTYDMPAWAGLDLGAPACISQIRYIPRNDDNNIRIGDTYELVFWEQGKWTSLGTKVADKEWLEFDDCPVDALFMLHNHSRGKEERIFTYENGRQVWW